MKNYKLRDRMSLFFFDVMCFFFSVSQNLLILLMSFAKPLGNPRRSVEERMIIEKMGEAAPALFAAEAAKQKVDTICWALACIY